VKLAVCGRLAFISIFFQSLYCGLVFFGQNYDNDHLLYAFLQGQSENMAALDFYQSNFHQLPAQSSGSIDYETVNSNNCRIFINRQTDTEIHIFYREDRPVRKIIYCSGQIADQVTWFYRDSRLISARSELFGRIWFEPPQNLREKIMRKLEAIYRVF